MNCLAAALIALTACLADPDPAIRDHVAFERLSAAMRAGEMDRSALATIKAQLLTMVTAPDLAGFARPFAILTLAEVARTDRLNRWMPDAEFDDLVGVASSYLSGITDYRAYNDKDGYRHGVAHGSDLAMQLALNARTTKAQLDRLLRAIAMQIAPRDPTVAYWAGEPDRLARAVAIIAQRRLHSDVEWKAWLADVIDPKPLASWNVAFQTEVGIRKHHNVRAFLLSLLATASATDDAGLRQLLDPLRESLKTIQ